MKQSIVLVLTLLMLLTIGCSSATNASSEVSSQGDMFDAIAEDRPVQNEAGAGSASEGSVTPADATKESEPEAKPEQRTLAVKEQWYGDQGTGSLVKRIEYTTSGKIARIKTYGNEYKTSEEIREYNDDGEIIREVTTHFDREGKATQTEETIQSDDSYITYRDGNTYTWIEYVRDDSGRVIKEIDHMDHGYTYNQLYTENEYDSKGQKIRSVEYWNGTIDSERLYEYDDRGNCIALTRYVDGAIQSQVKYDYDENNNCTCIWRYDADIGDFRIYTKNEYDEKGNLVRSWDFDKDIGDYCKAAEHEYNKEGKCVLDSKWNASTSDYDYCVHSVDDSYSIRSSGEFSTEITQRNSDGFITEVKQVTIREGIVIIWSFEYDSDGRFIVVQEPSSYNSGDRTVNYNRYTFVYKYW